MSNIRLFYPESLSINLEGKLDKAQSHYLTKVMRIPIGGNFSLFNKFCRINSFSPIIIINTLLQLFML